MLSLGNAAAAKVNRLTLGITAAVILGQKAAGNHTTYNYTRLMKLIVKQWDTEPGHCTNLCLLEPVHNCHHY